MMEYISSYWIRLVLEYREDDQLLTAQQDVQ